MDQIEGSDKIVIIDNGSGSIKAGLSDADEPSAIFPSVVGHQKDKQSYEIFVGDDALKNRGIL